MKLKSITVSIFVSILLHLVFILFIIYWQNNITQDTFLNFSDMDMPLSITLSENKTGENKINKTTMDTKNIDYSNQDVMQKDSNEMNNTISNITKANDNFLEKGDLTQKQQIVLSNNNSSDFSSLVLNSEIFTYPYEAKKHNIQGEVLIRIYFGDDGKVSNVKLLKTSGFSFLDAYTVKKAFKLVLKSYNELVREYLDVLVIYRLKGAAVISYQ